MVDLPDRGREDVIARHSVEAHDVAAVALDKISRREREAERNRFVRAHAAWRPLPIT